MKKILFINHIANYTGAPLVLLSLLQEIKRKHPDEKLYVLNLLHGPMETELNNVAEVYTPYNDDCRGIRKFLPFWLRRKRIEREFEKWLLEPKFNLIYANTIASIEKAVEIKHILNIPIIAHVHEMEYSFHLYGMKFDLISQCDKYIAVSTSVLATLERYGADKSKITVIPPFSNNLDKVNEVNASFVLSGINDGDFVIGFSGYGSWRKGTDLFPLIVKHFKDKYPNIKCKFVWVGHTDYAAIEHDAKMLNVWEDIILTGAVPNPMDYYNKFDIFVLLSREDPFPLVCMECAALSKPIILFEGCTGIVDLIKNDISGIHVSYLDIDAMTDAIYRLYGNIHLRLRFGENNRQILNSRFSKQASLECIETMLL